PHRADPGCRRPAGRVWRRPDADRVKVQSRTTRARRLRRDMTEAEKRLWRKLRELGLPWRFRRQHPIGRHIVDFACPAAKLVIELDGGQHAISLSADELRNREIAERGYRVIRFWKRGCNRKHWGCVGDDIPR